MTQEVRDLVDRAPLSDELRRQAVTHQMGTGYARKLDPAPLQSRTHDSRNGGAALEWARRWRIGQKHLRTTGLWPGMQDVVCERRAGFLQKRHDPVAPCLGSAHEYLSGTPADVLKLKRSQLLVAQSGGCSATIRMRTARQSG